MTDPQPLPLAALEQVCQAATKGPWTNRWSDSDTEDHIHTVANTKEGLPKKSVAVVSWGCSCCKADADVQDIANAQFIATFNPLLITRLLAVLRAQREALYLVWDKVLTEYHSEDSPVRQAVEAALALTDGG